MMPVQVSRTVASEELAARRIEALEQAWRGTVMVSPFISPGEQKIAHVVMEQQYGSLILIRPEGFPPLYKPGGAFFDLCAQGRFLVLSPFPYTGRKQPLTRERCLEMNRWVGALCRTEAPVKLNRGEHEIVVALDRAGRKQGEGRPETGIPIVG